MDRSGLSLSSEPQMMKLNISRCHLADASKIEPKRRAALETRLFSSSSLVPVTYISVWRCRRRRGFLNSLLYHKYTKYGS